MKISPESLPVIDNDRMSSTPAPEIRQTPVRAQDMWLAFSDFDYVETPAPIIDYEYHPGAHYEDSR